MTSSAGQTNKVYKPGVVTLGDGTEIKLSELTNPANNAVNTATTNFANELGVNFADSSTQTANTAVNKLRQGNPQLVNGNFDYESIQNDFFNSPIDPTDAAQLATRRAAQANIVQSAFDNQLATTSAFNQAELNNINAQNIADLELRNTTQNALTEFNLGANQIGLQFDLQNQFAKDQNTRDKTLAGYQAGLQKNQTRLEGQQQRAGIQTQGAQSRSLARVEGDQARQTQQDAGRIESGLIGDRGFQDRLTQGQNLQSQENQIGLRGCLLYTSPSPRDRTRSRMPSSA